MSERRRDRKHRRGLSGSQFLGRFREFLGEPGGDNSSAALAVSAKQIDNVSRRDHYDRVRVFLDFLVGLQINPAGGYKDPKLTVLSREIRRDISRTPTEFDDE
jgi:hypothetical protein